MEIIRENISEKKTILESLNYDNEEYEKDLKKLKQHLNQLYKQKELLSYIQVLNHFKENSSNETLDDIILSETNHRMLKSIAEQYKNLPIDLREQVFFFKGSHNM